jgi:hypothetical protein
MVICTNIDATPTLAILSMISHVKSNYAIHALMASPRKHGLQAEMLVHPPAKKRRLAKKTVRFAEDRNTVRSRHVSTEDLNKSWLQPEEYEKIRENNWATLRAIKSVGGNVSGLDVNKVCVRGLELIFGVVVFNNTSQRKQPEFAEKILMQHRVEKDLGFSDPDSLRILSRALSKVDQARALKIASIDACCC